MVVFCPRLDGPDCAMAALVRLGKSISYHLDIHVFRRTNITFRTFSELTFYK